MWGVIKVGLVEPSQASVPLRLVKGCKPRNVIARGAASQPSKPRDDLFGPFTVAFSPFEPLLEVFCPFLENIFAPDDGFSHLGVCKSLVMSELHKINPPKKYFQKKS